MFMVISVSRLALPADPKCADVTQLMGLRKGNQLLISGQEAFTLPKTNRSSCACLHVRTRTHTQVCKPRVHILQNSS